MLSLPLQDPVGAFPHTPRQLPRQTPTRGLNSPLELLDHDKQSHVGKKIVWLRQESQLTVKPERSGRCYIGAETGGPLTPSDG